MPLISAEFPRGRFRQLLKSADKMIKDADTLVLNVNQQVDPLSENLQEAVGDLRKLLQNADGQIQPISAKLQDALVSARKALDGARTTLASVVAQRTTLDPPRPTARRRSLRAAAFGSPLPWATLLDRSNTHLIRRPRATRRLTRGRNRARHMPRDRRHKILIVNELRASNPVERQLGLPCGNYLGN